MSQEIELPVAGGMEKRAVIAPGWTPPEKTLVGTGVKAAGDNLRELEESPVKRLADQVDEDL